MAETTPLFVNVDDVFGADALTTPFGDLIDEGRVSGHVVSEASPQALAVKVSAGASWVQGDGAGQPCYRCASSADVNLTLATADATNGRIDLIVAHVYDDVFDSSGDEKWLIEKVTGTPAATPVAPALPDSCLYLGQVTVAANATTIADADIDTTRTREWGLKAGERKLVDLTTAADGTLDLDSSYLGDTSPYSTLVLEIEAYGVSGSNSDSVGLQVDGQTTGIYQRMTETESGTTDSVTGSVGQTGWIVGWVPGGTAGSRGFIRARITNDPDASIREMLGEYYFAYNDTAATNLSRGNTGGDVAMAGALDELKITTSLQAGARVRVYGVR